MNSSRSIVLLFTIATVGISLPLEAQTLYRCGKVFQDRPCDTAAQGKAISTGSSSSPPPTQAVSDSRCVQRGERARKIMWAREVGKTKDEQIATSMSQDDRDLIEDVYRMRGTSSNVSAAIEAQCDERAKKMLEAGKPAMANPGEPVPLPTSTSSPGQDVASETAKKNLCDRLAESLQNVQDAERTGGSARQMDSLRKERRNVESQRQAAGC